MIRYLKARRFIYVSYLIFPHKLCRQLGDWAGRMATYLTPAGRVGR